MRHADRGVRRARLRGPHRRPASTACSSSDATARSPRRWRRCSATRECRGRGCAEVRSPTLRDATSPSRVTARAAGTLYRAAAHRVKETVVSLSIGIVGLPNVGKSTLFTALTRKAVGRVQLPVLHHRAERRRRAGARRAARPARRARASREDRAGDGRVRRHRRPGEGRERGRGARQPVPRQHPRDRRDRRGRALLRATRTSCTSTARSTRRATSRRSRTELVLADLGTVERALPRLEKDAKRDKALAAKHDARAARAAHGWSRGTARARWR